MLAAGTSRCFAGHARAMALLHPPQGEVLGSFQGRDGIKGVSEAAEAEPIPGGCCELGVVFWRNVTSWQDVKAKQGKVSPCPSSSFDEQDEVHCESGKESSRLHLQSGVV